ncbi:hypothetical protein G7Y89_g7717 [Cudoniella acicularis]|uniref:Protein kinase domain-containing protein n=1 Tax=Cudoniella acicularis TaxID=354080 RepID=A0A8H4RIR7_9HELO|nr:hypothetical protein G7Y89_g7717 [Cudoniella acicularis]
MPGEEATLECGRWEILYDWVLISPCSERAAAIKPRADSRKRTGEDGKKTGDERTGTNEKKTVEDEKKTGDERTWDNEKKTVEDEKRTRDNEKKTREDGKRPRVRALNMLVGKTDRTLVFKATRIGTTVAIKPSIIKLLNYDAPNLYLELEYSGQDLSKFVDRRLMSNLSEDIAHQIWIDISSGVEYLYSKKILHLNIKARNILLSEGRRAKICDFGFSVQHAIEPVLWDGGTPAYIPPEFLHTSKRGRPADIWDYGLVIGFILRMWPLPSRGRWIVANIRKEKGDTAAKMLEWLDEVERSKERIPDKYSLLLKMLAIDPSKRITSSDLVKNLRALPQAKALTGELLL